MRTSENTTPLFVTVFPDWSKGVKIEAVHESMLFTSRAGLEQRQRSRMYGRYRITFQRCGYTREEWAARWQQVREEHRNICILPFWSEGENATRIAGNQALCVSAGVHLRVSADDVLGVGQCAYSLPAPLRSEWWQAARYAFLFDGAEGQYQQILSAASEEEMHLQTGAHGGIVRGFALRRARGKILLGPPENDDLGNFDTARIFPCVACRRVMDQDDQTGASLESYDETLIFETL